MGDNEISGSDQWECPYCGATGKRSEGELFSTHFAENHDSLTIISPFISVTGRADPRQLRTESDR